MLRAAKVLVALYSAGLCAGASPIGIFLNFKTQPEAAVVDLMKREVLQILEPAHLDITFHRVGDPESLKSFGKIIVIRFRGSCRSGWGVDPVQLDEPAVLDFPALGRTEVSEGRVLPYVHIYCNEVRAFVPHVSRLSIQKLYARALGRVVTHELYHALLGTLEHSKAGLARPAQSPVDLTRDNAALDEISLDRLRRLWGELPTTAYSQVSLRPDDRQLSEIHPTSTMAVAGH